MSTTSKRIQLHLFLLLYTPPFTISLHLYLSIRAVSHPPSSTTSLLAFLCPLKNTCGHVLRLCSTLLSYSLVVRNQEFDFLLPIFEIWNILKESLLFFNLAFFCATKLFHYYTVSENTS